MDPLVTDGSLLARESELYFERGGPVYRLMQRIGLVVGEGPSLLRRSMGMLFLTWLPLFILSVIDGRALGGSPRQAFLLDFASYARFFITIPLLFYAEVVIGPTLTNAAQQFVRAGLVRTEHATEYNAAISRAVRWRESIWAELIIGMIAIIGASAFTVEMMQGDAEQTWKSLTIQRNGISTYSLAGFWFHFVAVPLLQFFYFRWLWRVLIWIRFLYDISRLDLGIVATHADQAGGLLFLERAQVSLGILFSAFSVIASADMAFRIVFDGAKLEAFKMPIGTIVLIAEILCFAPLLLFSPLLERKKGEWTRRYSHLVIRLNRKFHETWIEGGEKGHLPPKSDIPEFSALIDLGSSFRMIREMKTVLFNTSTAIRLVIPVLLPFFPLLPLVMPIEQMIHFASKLLF